MKENKQQEKIEQEKETLMADICGSGRVSEDKKYIMFTVSEMEEIVDYLHRILYTKGQNERK